MFTITIIKLSHRYSEVQMNNSDLMNHPVSIDGLCLLDENGGVVRTFRMPSSDLFDKNTESKQFNELFSSFNHQESVKRLEKDRVLVVRAGGSKRGERYHTASEFEIDKLLAIFNHLRERYDRLIDTADESTLDEILSTEHFIVGEAE